MNTETEKGHIETSLNTEQIMKATGLSREAVGTLLLWIMQDSPCLPLLSALITSNVPYLLLSAVTSNYKDDYTRFKGEFVPAWRMYAAEKVATTDELLKFIDKYRQDNGLAPL